MSPMVPFVSGWLVAMLAPCGIVGFNKGRAPPVDVLRWQEADHHSRKSRID